MFVLISSSLTFPRMATNRRGYNEFFSYVRNLSVLSLNLKNFKTLVKLLQEVPTMLSDSRCLPVLGRCFFTHITRTVALRCFQHLH